VTEALEQAVRAGDLAEAERLLAAGHNGSAVIHLAAELGPLALVELLIRRGAIEWLPDAAHRTPLDAARTGSAPDREAIIELLARPVIRDQAARAAVAAIHAGDVGALERIVDEEPRLLHERFREPDCYREAPSRSYFLDPQLLWFVANNPLLVDRMPANIVEVTELLLARGADGLDVTLELVMTSGSAREQGHQAALMETLLAAGAVATPAAVDRALAHGETAAVQALGPPLTVSTAAAFGRADDLGRLLAASGAGSAQMALAHAVISDQPAAARVALDSGADVNAYLPVHSHSVALHQAALHDNVPLLELLIERGARLDIRDTFWNGTPHDWAIHEDKPLAASYLEGLERQRSSDDSTTSA
jgi:peptide-methionine (S)-S-oxide reductase